jgi:DNA-directed RNA polymerase subunit omega
MNAELMQKALEKVGSANTLVNMVSRRVRQLNAGGQPLSGSSVAINGHMGVADIALLEIADGRLGWEMPELSEWSLPGRKTHKSSKPVVKGQRTG